MSLAGGYDSIVHRVLDILEIVELIFSFMDKRSNISNAQVCRKWSNQALNFLWREGFDLFRLFSILSPFAWAWSKVGTTVGKFILLINALRDSDGLSSGQGQNQPNNSIRMSGVKR